MPDEVCTALRQQHNANYQGTDHIYPNLIYLSLALLSEQGIGSGPRLSIPDALLERLGLERESADKVVGKVLDARDALRSLVSKYQGTARPE